MHRAGCSRAGIEFAPIFLNSLYLSQVTQLHLQSVSLSKIPLLMYVKALIHMRIIIRPV